MATRFGVDVGGTFTDLIFYDDKTGEVRIGKVPTTPGELDRGVAEIVDQVVGDALPRSAYFLHATTVGLNALLERRGAKVGLLTTRGFRDILEIARGDRPVMYDARWKAPPPLVPRHLRLPVTERVLPSGEVLIPLVERDVREAAEVFIEEKVECVAVLFLNAYSRPEHEQRAAEILREAGFEHQVSLSHVVSGELREFERCTTTTIDAYVRPLASRYLADIEHQLSAGGFEGRSLITRSGGGAMSFAEAAERPFETIMSGPAAGVTAASQLSRQLDSELSITADVGGTSFDTALITNGQPHIKFEGEVDGLPLQTPWVDVRSIGAGGGSIAYAEEGIMRVGPQSAGAEPGPVCYGRGGTQPTVTDAAASLGMLPSDEARSGLSLDIPAAGRALAELADSLNLALDRTAEGVMKIATVAMAQAIRSITVEKGEDPREATMIAFGGAGPLFATLIARELEITQIAVPPHAGNFSAVGLLDGDVTRSATTTVLRPLDEEGLAAAMNALDRLFKQLEARDTSPRIKGDETAHYPALDLRYQGQENALTVALPTDDGAPDPIRTRELFTVAYERAFGHQLLADVEILSVRATNTTPLLQRNVPRRATASTSVTNSATSDCFSFFAGKRESFQVIDRQALAPGSTTTGPSIVVEPTTTTYVDVDFSAMVDPGGNLLLTRASD